MLEEILFQYQNLVHKVDQVWKNLRLHYDSHIICSPGCSHCCEVERTILSIEAYVVEQQLATLSPQRLKKLRSRHRLKNDTRCPMLWGNLCAIYFARPIICRTHGLPIFYCEAEITFIDYCRLNFTQLDKKYQFDDKFVLDMAEFNVELVRLDHQFAEFILGKPWRPTNRQSLRKILKNLTIKGPS